MFKGLILKAASSAGYTVLHNSKYAALRAAAEKKAEMPVDSRDEVRQLFSFGAAIPPTQATPETVAAIRSVVGYQDALDYFESYPPRSLMSDHCRATLFTLIRMLHPQVVAEVGTFFAGTTEVIARALWENGEGNVVTTDPFGAERCPEIISRWPQALRDITKYFSLSSMEFFLKMERERIKLDIVLVDGNHDFEFALFDLQMAAKLLKLGGLIIMDNAEQTGPFEASRKFLEFHPEWCELGSAIDSFDVSRPFNETRASLPGTSFIILQAPDFFAISAAPRSWGQTKQASPRVTGISLNLAAQKTGGKLHYQAILRAYGARDVEEIKSVGSFRIDLAGSASIVLHEFKTPITPKRQSIDAHFTFEIELAWQADPCSQPLAIASIPVALTN